MTKKASCESGWPYFLLFIAKIIGTKSDTVLIKVLKIKDELKKS